MRHSESLHKTKRWKTRVVRVSNLLIGGGNPIRIQSMTTSNTRDVEATVDQIMKLADWGCEIARVTVQGKKEAESCEDIKNRLLQRGYTIPLVADIHFYPPAAMMVAEFVDKVRVNPGNYIDRRATFKMIDYDDDTYAKEIEKIEEGFSPLVLKCKKLKKAMRIGTNHGSLSDRIMNRYGDTPRGMVESALEFARICRKHEYHDFIFSMKASHPIVMMEAYRLLVAEMMKLGWDYPLHLGVTEAGEGEDGRIKSAMGIGSLLMDGIGDTIRVSLTEDPWREIDPCKRLIQLFEQSENKDCIPFEEKHRGTTQMQRIPAEIKKNSFLHRDGSVLLHVKPTDLLEEGFYETLGCKKQLGRPQRTLSTVDLIHLEKIPNDPRMHAVIHQLTEAGIGFLSEQKHVNGIFLQKLGKLHEPLDQPFAIIVTTEEEKHWEKIIAFKPLMILLRPSSSRIHNSRRFFAWMQKNALRIPVILDFVYEQDLENFIIQAATECGAILCDGLGDGIALQSPNSLEVNISLAFNILQCARMRTIKTEFISCPGCGRTLFDLQKVAGRIRKKTAHLPGVKIAIMGCIVNGPGEMADADFGYVGSRPGKIDLYVGKTCVERNIEFDEADEKLIDLIKAHGRWVEVESTKEEAKV